MNLSDVFVRFFEIALYRGKTAATLGLARASEVISANRDEDDEADSKGLCSFEAEEPILNLANKSFGQNFVFCKRSAFDRIFENMPKTWYLMPFTPCTECTSCAKNKTCKFSKAFNIVGATLVTDDDVKLISRSYVRNVIPDTEEFVKTQMCKRINKVRVMPGRYSLEVIQEAVNDYAQQHINDEKADSVVHKDPQASVLCDKVESILMSREVID